jgi:hypothetical protein
VEQKPFDPPSVFVTLARRCNKKLSIACRIIDVNFVQVDAKRGPSALVHRARKMRMGKNNSWKGTGIV